MIVQARDAMGRLNVFGVGAIYSSNEQQPVIYTNVKETAKGSFTITASVQKNPEIASKKYIYQNIPCAVYGRQYNKELFAVLETLKVRDKVIFAGTYYDHKAEDKTSGKMIDFSEVRIEMLIPISPLISTILSDLKVRRLKTDKDIDKAVEGAKNRSKRESKYKF